MSLYEDGLASMRGEEILFDPGKRASLARAREIAKKIETPLKAQKILVLSLQTLMTAARQLDGYNLWDKATGALAANVDLIRQRMDYIVRVQKEIPIGGVLPRLVAEKVALAALQVTDTLELTRGLVRQSMLESGLRGLIRSFWAAFEKILREIVSEVILPGIKAVAAPLLPIAIGTGAVLLLFSQLKKTAAA